MNKLKEKRNRLYEQVTQLVQTAENETRSLTEEETASYQSMIAEIRSLDEQINRAEEVRNLALDKSGKPAPDASGSDREQAERRAFESFLTGRENRDAVPVNMTYGTNGAVIPTSIMNKVIDRVKEISPIFAAATKYPVKGQITIPKIDRSSGDITVAFAAEFAELTAKGFKFSSITLSPHLAGCLVKLSKQLINNSQIDVVSVVIDKMAESIAAFIEGFLLNGDSNIANSGLKGSIDTTNNKISVASVAALTADNLIDVQDTIPDAYQGNAFWIMNATMRTKIRKLKDGQGNYLLVPDFQRGSGYTLLGKPVYVTDNLPTAAAAASGDIIAYYGDFSGLAVKTGETAEIQLLNEQYATQHVLGVVSWLELDARVENTQKITALALT